MKTKMWAEIGINHNGELDIAKKIMMVAAVADSDACKFQKKNPDLCVPDDQKDVIKKTPWGEEMTYIEYKWKMEFSYNEYDDLFRFAKMIGVDIFASVWDLPSLQFMAGHKPHYMKIPSALITEKELVTACAEWARDAEGELVISTGMSTEEEVDQCYKWIKDILPEKEQLCMLACNSAYPAKVEELNLRSILYMKKKYAANIGYSGHEEQIGTTVATTMFDVYAIERHVTLDNKRMLGTDQHSSLNSWGWLQLCNGVKDLEDALGTEEIKLYDSEVPFRKKLRGE